MNVVVSAVVGLVLLVAALSRISVSSTLSNLPEPKLNCVEPFREKPR